MHKQSNDGPDSMHSQQLIIAGRRVGTHSAGLEISGQSWSPPKKLLCRAVAGLATLTAVACACSATRSRRDNKACHRSPHALADISAKSVTC